MALNFGQQPAFGAQGAAASGPPIPPIGSAAFPAAGGAIGAQPAFGAQGQAAPGPPPPAFGFRAAVQPPPSNLTVSALGHTAQLAAAIPGVPSFPAAASSSAAPFGFAAAAASSSAAPFGFAAAASSSTAPFGFSAAALAIGGSATEAHPDLPPQLLQRISTSDSTLTKLQIQRKSNFNEGGCRVLARALSLNTCITSLDLHRTSVGAAGACVLFPALTHLTDMTYLNLHGTGLGSSGASHLCSALTHLTAMTFLNLIGTRLGSSGASHLCSALTHLTAMTELYLQSNQLTADDGARICGAAAAAGMTRLQMLDLSDNGFTGSDVVGCGAWRQLNLPQPPDEIVRKCTGGFGSSFAPLVSYLLSDDKVSCHAIRIFVVGDSTVPPPPPPPFRSVFAATSALTFASARCTRFA
jgi:hypothetical protein